MVGTNIRAETQNAVREKDHLLNLPGVSPLHSIPGLDSLSRSRFYPKGSAILVEGHAPRGVYVLQTGRAKLSITSAEGRKLIMRIARPGDLLGIHATLAGHSYESEDHRLPAEPAGGRAEHSQPRSIPSDW